MHESAHREIWEQEDEKIDLCDIYTDQAQAVIVPSDGMERHSL